MHKGTIEHIDKDRIYIKTTHHQISKDKHAKHLLLGKQSHRILPVLKNDSHNHLKKGDNVHFQVSPFDNKVGAGFFYGMPIMGAIVGFSVGSTITYKASGLIILTILFMALGLNVQMLLKKYANPFRKINIEILEKDISKRAHKLSRRKK